MAREWYVKSGDRVEGPFTSRELADRAASGRVLPTDTVSTDRTKWVRAGKVKGLTFPKPAPTDTMPYVASPAPFEDVPGYALEGVLGEGGMGVVYRARQLKLDRVVALKTVAVAFAANHELLLRFEKEAVALARFQHPNIVAVYDSGRAGDRLFFAMELLEGEDLDRLIDRRGPLDERTAWLIARQTAAALAHAARHHVTHRDIKPANLFLTPAPIGSGLPAGVPMVKVTDFGLALTRGRADARLTMTGAVVGTPIYMAPEQFQTSDIDHRADIYALGATVFHALSGQLPFNAPSIWEVMAAKSLPAPRLGPPISKESVELVAAMMAVNPEDRPCSYEEVIARIDALPCVRDADRPALPDVMRKPVPRARPGVLVAVAAAVVVLVAAGVGYAIFGRGGSAPQANTTSRYTPSDRSMELYAAGSVLHWQGTGVHVEDDDDKNRVLTGTGTIRRAIDPAPNFRVTLGLDLHTATALEVAFLMPSGDGPRTLLRVARDGVTLGTRAGAGKFTPIGEPVPYPDKAGYREVTFEKAGEVWRVAFDGRPVGTVPDDGAPRANEFHLVAEGGAVRIESARWDELTESR